MTTNIAIIGAGGFGREVKVLIDDINNHNSKYNLIGFFDDNNQLPSIINGVPYLGKVQELLSNRNYEGISLAIAVGNPIIKKKIVESIQERNFEYPILIHPTVIKGNDFVDVGRGTIICAGNILTCNINIEEFVILNLACTVGHDTKIKRYSSFMPSVNISGEVKIHECVYVGTGAKIINQIEVGENTIVGAGAVVSKSLPANCTAVGIPAKPIKFH